MKQISKVFEAVVAGYETSAQISEIVGLSVPHVSSYLTDLKDAGLIRLTHRKHSKSRRRYVRDFNRYAAFNSI